MSGALDCLAFEFFRTFARFEYALKVTGFHYGDGAAEPNWRAFAESESVRNIFDNPTDNVLKTAIEYILTHPPKKQSIENGVLTWNEHLPSTDLQSDLVPPPWEPAAKPARSHGGLEAFGSHTPHSLDGGIAYKPLTRGWVPFTSIGVGPFLRCQSESNSHSAEVL